MRKREQITKLFQSGPQGPQLKRQRKVKYPEVENALLAWIAERKAAGDMPGGKEIKQKVVTLQTDLGMDLNEGGGLKGTNGWLESFIHTFVLAVVLQRSALELTTTSSLQSQPAAPSDRVVRGQAGEEGPDRGQE